MSVVWGFRAQGLTFGVVVWVSSLEAAHRV